MRYSGSRKRDRGNETNYETHQQHLLKCAESITGKIACVALILFASPAAAHSGTGLPGGFVAGVAHPLTGLDHMLAMASVGLWGHFLRRPLIYLLPIVFPIMMAAGAGTAMIGIPLPPVEFGIALSVIILGSLILGAVRLPVLAACAVVGLFALFHGYAHGLELPSAADPIGYSLGFVLATGSLHVIGIAIGTLAFVPRGETMLRALGGVTLLFGVYFLWSALS
jgi:urease accessory protein